MMSNAAKHFDILAITLKVLHNYFNIFNKIFRSVFSKFLDASAKPFFLCTHVDALR